MADWPADKVERRQVAELIPYARNARTHSEAQVAQLAASIREWGWTIPVLIDEDGGIIAGHGRIMAARKIGIDDVPCMVARGWTEAQKRAYIIADNKLTINAGWDEAALAVELSDIMALGFDQTLIGFSAAELGALTFGEPSNGDADAVPELPVDPVTKLGDVWLLGSHRLMCGDSIDKRAAGRLMAGSKAALLHADPPYGMGKETEGIANDNLYREKLDAFQMKWWAVFRPFLDDNASAYIWGNAADLWRLWYRGGLSECERMTIRNEIVWAKGDAGAGGISHQGAEGLRLFPQSTERCLFFMLGEQGFNNNADNYWDGWEPIRIWLDGERKKSGLTTDQCNRICCKQNMTQSAFTKGGFRLISEADYLSLHNATEGKFFKRNYEDLRMEYETLKVAHNKVKGTFYGERAYFDNTHDNMTDVWEFPRVTGEDRFGHATPKPAAMMVRVMKSSLPDGGLCVEPFCGSGSTLIAAETCGRVCYAMEINPAYCDVTVKRWQDLTGNSATHETDGITFDGITAVREVPITDLDTAATA